MCGQKPHYEQQHVQPSTWMMGLSRRVQCVMLSACQDFCAVENGEKQRQVDRINNNELNRGKRQIPNNSINSTYSTRVLCSDTNCMDEIR